MAIWSAEIKDLEKLYESIKGQFPDVEKEMERLIKADDENMILLYSRRCLEVIITDLCECELKRPRKTEPLKGIVDKLHKEDKVPAHIITSMHGLNELSTFGTHPKDFDPEQVKPVLNNLDIIIKWYLKYKVAKTDIKTEKDTKDEIKISDVTGKNIHKPKKKLILLVSGLSLVIVIVVLTLFVFDIVGAGGKNRKLEKSIAVLPFIDDSPEADNSPIINGLMDEILINLQKINDLIVISRNSVEQFRGDNKPSTPDIAKQLGVNYIVEGSGQQYGNNLRLRVQLIFISNGKERHLWGKVYDNEINRPEDYLDIQSDVAESIANELKAIITPKEIQLIDKLSTTSLTALDFYLKGREEHWKYWFDNNNKEALERAEELYYKALEYDSTYALAFTGLAWVYWEKKYWKEYFLENFLDSVLVLANIALSHDNQIAEAYTIRGQYYSEIGNHHQALEEFDKASNFNPNDWWAYRSKGILYSDYDLVKSLENYSKAISLNHGSQLPGLFRGIGYVFYCAGFPERNKYYLQEALKLDDDSAEYFGSLAWHEFFLGNYEKAVDFGKKGFAIDSSQYLSLSILGDSYIFLGQNKESLKYYKKWLEKLVASERLSLYGMYRIGYAYWKNGFKEEAEYYFDKQIEYGNTEIKMDRSRSNYTYFDLAGVYAFRGEKDRALENLRIFNQRIIIPNYIIYLIKNDPLFDSLRNEPEFQQIVKDIESKYQTEHERVRKWLEEKGML